MLSSSQSLSQKECLAYIYGFDENLIVLIIDLETQNIIDNMVFSVAANLLKSIPIIFNGKAIKAVILNIFAVFSSDFENNLEFCKEIRQKLDEMKIFHHFVPNSSYIITSALMIQNIALKIDEPITVVAFFSNAFVVYNCKYTENGYKILSLPHVQYNENDDAETVYENILQFSTQNKIIAAIMGTTKLPIVQRLKEKASKPGIIAIVEIDIWINGPKFACETYKCLMDKSHKIYYVLPVAVRTYFLRNNIDMEIPLIVEAKKLPLTYKFELGKQNFDFAVRFSERQKLNFQVLQKLEFDDKCHVHQTTLSIDINNFPTVKTEPILLPHILEIPQFFNAQIHDKRAVIVFHNGDSFICVFNEEKGGYEFLDEWNGIYGRPLYISFDEEKPKFCEDAVQIFKSKPSFVVYDILNIMSTSLKKLHSNEVKDQPPWTFAITKDDENPILLEFDNFDGKKSAASPTFLMAMLLRQHLKAIKSKTGKKPKQLAFCIVDLDPKDKRVVDSIVEAFKLIKIDAISLN